LRKLLRGLLMEDKIEKVRTGKRSRSATRIHRQEKKRKEKQRTTRTRTRMKTHDATLISRLLPPFHQLPNSARPTHIDTQPHRSTLLQPSSLLAPKLTNRPRSPHHSNLRLNQPTRFAPRSSDSSFSQIRLGRVVRRRGR